MNMNQTDFTVVDNSENITISTISDIDHPDYLNNDLKQSLLRSLYNYMKISEMSNYGSYMFENYLDKNIKHLNENDFITLATSYWCNSKHFLSMVERRGSNIFNGQILKIEVTQDIINATIEGGANIDKIKTMLLQRRKDIGDINICQKLENEFFFRNCPKRFTAYETPIRAFAENGWLTKELATVGQKCFLEFISEKYRSSRPSASVLRKWCALTQLMSAQGGIYEAIDDLPEAIQTAYTRGYHTYLFKTLNVTSKNQYLLRFKKNQRGNSISSSSVVNHVITNNNNNKNKNCGIIRRGIISPINKNKTKKAIVHNKIPTFNNNKKTYIMKNNINYQNKNSSPSKKSKQSSIRLCSNLWNIITIYM